jgi:hypothetical protein
MNIFRHKENANQNYIEISSHLYQTGNHQENKQQQTLERMQGKRNPHTLLI